MFGVIFSKGYGFCLPIHEYALADDHMPARMMDWQSAS